MSNSWYFSVHRLLRRLRMPRLLLSCNTTVPSRYPRSVSNSFTSTHANASIVNLTLTTLCSLHGRPQPAACTKALTLFASFYAMPSASAVLLATGIAAWGLDIPNVDVVLQFDLPSDPKAFSHRCGRAVGTGKLRCATVSLAWEGIDHTGAPPLPLICLEQRQRHIIYVRLVMSICSDLWLSGRCHRNNAPISPKTQRNLTLPKYGKHLRKERLITLKPRSTL